MLHVFSFYMIGIIIGAIAMHGLTSEAGDEILCALFYSGVLLVLLEINGTYTAN